MSSPSFTRLLDWIALDPRLSDIAVRGYWILRAHVHETDDDPLVRVTDAGLAGMLGKSEKTAKRCRRQLEEAGLLVLVEQTTRTVRDPGTGRWTPRTTNVYRVVEEPPRGHSGPLSPWDWRRRFRGESALSGISRRTDPSAGRTDPAIGADTDDPLSTKPFQRTPLNESAPSAPEPGTECRAPARGAADRRAAPSGPAEKTPAPSGPANGAPPAPPAPPVAGPPAFPTAEPPAPPVAEPPGWAIGLLSPVPDAALARPAADRRALALRLAALADAGVDRSALAAAVASAGSAARPYPALSARLASPQAVRAWNARTLGAGTGTAPLPPGGRPGGAPDPTAPTGSAASARTAGSGRGSREPSDTAPGFTADSSGRAARTCPAHPAIRNVPGGTCALCGGPCRGFPGEDLAPPPAVPDTGQTGADRRRPERPFGAPAPGSGAEEPEIDPESMERMLDSLTAAARKRSIPAQSRGRGRAPTSAARAAADGMRGLLAELRGGRRPPS
ncbi:hypothetical protein J0910_19890 [Nocardiopsis sp. CNT-189]|uniref:hypothetical protein n=1 Tax=Nocardiopsis oceanisediminis TaxID=2816862 RepID=UPI003B2F9707